MKGLIKAILMWMVLLVVVMLIYIHKPMWFDQRMCTFVGGIFFSMLMGICIFPIGFILENM
jgi:hypothetical protein